MCTEWKSAVYEDALGSPGIEDLLVLKKKKLDVFMHPVFSYTS